MRWAIPRKCCDTAERATAALRGMSASGSTAAVVAARHRAFTAAVEALDAALLRTASSRRPPHRAGRAGRAARSAVGRDGIVARSILHPGAVRPLVDRCRFVDVVADRIGARRRRPASGRGRGRGTRCRRLPSSSDAADGGRGHRRQRRRRDGRARCRALRRPWTIPARQPAVVDDRARRRAVDRLRAGASRPRPADGGAGHLRVGHRWRRESVHSCTDWPARC